MINRFSFLILFAISTMGAMEEFPETPQGRCYWQELSEEMQQYILSFVPTPGQLSGINNVRLICKAVNRLTQDPAFLAEFAKRTFEQDRDQAQEILLQSAWFGKKEVAEAFINAHDDLKTIASFEFFFPVPHFSEIFAECQEDAQQEWIGYLRTLLAAGADPNQRAVMKLSVDDRLHAKNYITKTVSNRTPLMEACKHGDQEVAELLIAAGASVNDQDDCEVNALMEAIFSNNKLMVTLLLDNGADITSSVELAMRTLLSCVNNADTEILDLLFARGLQIPAVPEFGLSAQEAQSLAKMVIQVSQLLMAKQKNPEHPGECLMQ